MNARTAGVSYATLPSAQLASLASTGDAEALLHIGRRYLNGDRAPRDAAAAYSAWREAADKGHGPAMQQIARLYEEGRGVARNDSMATMWYRRAAEAGHREAMVALAQRLRNGRGAAPDARLAQQWMARAADLGSADAEHWLAQHADTAGLRRRHDDRRYGLMIAAAGLAVLIALAGFWIR
jgi:TPR repeat protein